MIYLMLVLPYVLVDLVGNERRQINAAIDSAVAGDPLHDLEDPCEVIIAALLVLLKWFMLVCKQKIVRRQFPTACFVNQNLFCKSTERMVLGLPSLFQPTANRI
jgi:hypothetical protein